MVVKMYWEGNANGDGGGSGVSNHDGITVTSVVVGDCDDGDDWL